MAGGASPATAGVSPGAAQDYWRGCRRLVGRKALLSAAARGLGIACAQRLAAEGAEVWITDRDPAALALALSDASAQGVELRALEMDSGDPSDVARCLAGVLERSGGIDILVNNAGGSLHTPYSFADQSDEDWRRVFDLNLMGAVWASRALLPVMVERGYGRVVNLGSKAGRFGSLIAGPNYAAAKGAIAALTRQMAMEYGPHGITVNCVCPGVVMTERTRGLWAERRTEVERARVLQAIPMRRHCEVEDIAATVAFLASDDASFITGVSLDVNGGQAMA
ncbi:MAG: SDR family oxidoreductase [Burkholderiaceae bacterium]|nr:SDR family oxidoreductase [Burkholderiaceae bacterium]